MQLVAILSNMIFRTSSGFYCRPLQKAVSKGMTPKKTFQNNLFGNKTICYNTDQALTLVYFQILAWSLQNNLFDVFIIDHPKKPDWFLKPIRSSQVILKL